MRSIEPQTLQRAVEFLRREIPALRSVHLFGSAVADALRVDSDIDLAIACEPLLPLERRLELADRCGEILGRAVDLVELGQVPLPLQARIVAEGRRLHVAEPTSAAFRENAILSRYCAFNEERRPLIAVIMQRGAIHA